MDLVLLPDGLITVEQGLECFNPYFNGSSTSTILGLNKIKILRRLFQSLF